MVDVNKVLNHKFKETEYELTEKDVALYSLSVGAGHKDLKFVYENSDDFQPIASMGVIFPYPVLLQVIDGISGMEFNPMMLLHGEQKLEILSKLPTSGKLITSSKVRGIYDKGSGALLVVDTVTRDTSNTPIFNNTFSLFIRGIGGFSGDKGPSEKSIPIPKRDPDATATYKTNEDQALLYRLAGGDLNPLHADPQMAKQGGFDKPILHGLCTMGIATRGVIEHFCGNDSNRLKSVSVRFSKPTIPGQTLQTEMYKISDTKLIFRTKTLETGNYVLLNAVAEIKPSTNSKM